MIDEKGLRELCARALQAQGPAFQDAIVELSRAIESWADTKEANGNRNHKAEN